MLEYVFEGTRNIWLIKLLDLGEWEEPVPCVTTGNRGIRIPLYDRNAHSGTQVVKAHSLNMILRLIVVLRIDQSSDLIKAAISQFSLYLVIQFNIVALEESATLDHGH